MAKAFITVNGCGRGKTFCGSPQEVAKAGAAYLLEQLGCADCEPCCEAPCEPCCEAEAPAVETRPKRGKK